MRYLLSLLIILLLISQAAAIQLENVREFRLPEKHPIKNITNIIINNTPINDSFNHTEINITPTNITNTTLNETIPINITNSTLNETNLSAIITPLNHTNLTVLNITKPINKTIINLTNTTLNETIPLNITNTTLNQTIDEEPEQSPPKIESKKTTYIYGGGKLLASKEEDTIKYHYQDRLGTDINSKTLPFGEEIKNEERFSFTGKELDHELYYFGARNYDPDLGQFIAKDSVEKNNPYAYVNNKPLSYIDPDGNDPVDVVINLIGYARTISQLNKENIKEKAVNEGVKQGVKATERATQDMAPSSRGIINGWARTVGHLVNAGVSSEEDKGKVLVENVAEDALKEIAFPGPLGGVGYGACKQSVKDQLTLVESTSVLNPETHQTLNERHQNDPAKPTRPANHFRAYPSIARANDAYVMEWTNYLSQQDTLTAQEMAILENYGVKINREDIVVLE